MTAARPTRPATGAPLLCAQCGYALLGLAETGACPECATPVRISIAAQSGSFPSSRHLRSAHFALGLLLLSTIAAPIMLVGAMASFFVVPSNWHLPYAGAAFGVAWLFWHGAWWRLASRDPTRAADTPRPRSGTLVLVLAALSLIAASAFGMVLTSNLLPRFGGVSFKIAARTLIYIAPLLLGAAQIWAGSRLLARYDSPRPKRARHTNQPDLPALRRSAMLTLVLTAAMTTVSFAAFYSSAAPTPAGAALPLPLAVYSVASTYLFFGMGLCSLVTAVNLIIAIVAARGRTRDALDDRRLLAAAAQELASERAP